VFVAESFQPPRARKGERRIDMKNEGTADRIVGVNTCGLPKAG
jgi:hypothetical protein